MSQWLRYALIVSLLLAITYSCIAAPAYVIVDQSIGQDLLVSKEEGIAFAENLEKNASIHDAEVIVLPMKAVRIVAMTQMGERRPNFEKVSEPVASPNEMTNQLADLLSTLPQGSNIFKMGREDAGWNEAMVVSENNEFLNEVPFYIDDGPRFDVLDFYLPAETTLNDKSRLDETILDNNLHMNWIWNKPACPLSGYRATFNVKRYFGQFTLPVPTEEVMSETTNIFVAIEQSM